MAMEVPHPHDENLIVFPFWCTMAHRLGFTTVYTARVNMLMLRLARAPQRIKHIDACRIHKEINVTQVT